MIGDVHPDPLALKALCYCDRGATTAICIEDQVSLIACRLDDTFKERFRFLGLISKVFISWACPGFVECCELAFRLSEVMA